MGSMKPGRASEMSPQQELLPLSSLYQPTHPPNTHTHTHTHTLTHSLPARNFWHRQGDTEPGDSLEAGKLEQKHHPDALPRVLELLPVFFQRPLAVASLPAQAAGKFQSLSFGVGLDWFTFGQRSFKQLLDS